MTSQSISEQAERISFLLGEVQRRLFSGAHKKLKPHWPDVTMRQARLLRLLGRHESMTMKELAQMADISTPTATGLVDRTVENGLVVREGDPNDRRVVRVKLTAKARDLRARFRRLRMEKIDRVLSQLSPADRKKLADAFETIDQMLAKAPANDES